jgi:hypothetical protein
MAERALPAAPAPRTVTVRVRLLVIAAAAFAVVAVISWSFHWLTGLEPTSFANSNVRAVGAVDASKVYVGPMVYRVTSDHARFLITFGYHNTASVPVTITGVEAVSPYGPIAGPTFRLADAGNLETLPGAFHPVRIPADGTRALTLVYGIRSRIPCHDVITVPYVMLHFTALRLGETQEIPLGDESLSVTGRC